MQTSSNSKKCFLKRMLFYWARLYGSHLKAGQKYEKLPPTYSLIFTTFSVFEGQLDDYCNEFAMCAIKKPSVLYNEDMRIVFVEMNRMNKKCSELVELRDICCYLFIHAHKLTAEERAHLSKTEEIKMALDSFDKIDQEEAMRIYELGTEIAEIDRLAILAEEKEKAEAKGVAKGKTETSHEIAANMLQEGYTISSISKVTGLSKTEISRLKNGK